IPHALPIYPPRIFLKIPRLNQANRPAAVLNKPADQPDKTVHNPAVPPARADSALYSAPGRSVHGAIDDLRIEFPEVSAGVLRTIHKQRVVELIAIPLVPQPAIQRPLLPPLPLHLPAQ